VSGRICGCINSLGQHNAMMAKRLVCSWPNLCSLDESRAVQDSLIDSLLRLSEVRSVCLKLIGAVILEGPKHRAHQGLPLRKIDTLPL
jgi:hypothetical protein